MAFTRKWSDLINLVSKQIKNAPTTDVDAIHCDFVSSKMATVLPWSPLVTTIPEGTTLVDGQQDYSVPADIYRLVDGTMYLLRTDGVTPESISLEIVDQLQVDLAKRSVWACRNIAHQAGVGLLRLEFALHIPEGQTWDIRGNYQLNQTKVTNVNQACWFDDKYADVAAEGLAYWMYRMVDDPRAGTATERSDGNYAYSGQLGVFMARLREMAKAEDLSGGDRAFPAEPLGVGAFIGNGIWGY